MALRPAPHASDPFLKPTPQDINADAINDCGNILDRLSAAGSRASCGIFLYLAVQRLITSELSLPRNTPCQSLQPGVLFAPIGCRLCHRLMKCGFAHRLGVGSPYGLGSSQTVCWLAGAYCGGAAARPDFRARPRGRHPSRLAGGQCHWLGNASIANRSRQQPGSDADDYCAICATISVAANSFIPQAPQLPALFASRLIEHFDPVAISSSVPPQRTFFQSRAPPLA